MNKHGIAAWLLSLATDPDRATTTVGDFSEDAAAHPPGWFWWQIARTLGAHIAHDFVDAPGRLLLGCVAGAAFFLAVYIVLLWSLRDFYGIWSQIYYSFVPEPSGDYIPAPPGEVLVPALYLFTAAIATGQCIARVSRRPMAAWVLWTIGCTLVWIGVSVSTKLIPFPSGMIFLVLLGSIWERRRSLKTA